jgi:G2/mitotic-specific cyclin 1/2
LAAASMWLARFVLGKEDWVCHSMICYLCYRNDALSSQTPNLAHYSSYAESAIIPTANLMINYVLKPARHGSFFKKYAAKKFMKVQCCSRPRYVELT